MTAPSPADQAAAQDEATAREYGQFVAVLPIDVDGARAYNPGHRVPATNVAHYGYEADGLVQRVDQPSTDTPAQEG